MLKRDHSVAGVPRLSRHHLRRTRLLELFDAGHPLTLLRGPTGSGKTALVAEWARSTPANGVWVSIDSDIGSRLRYWRTVITAMDDAGLLPDHSPLRAELEPTGLRRTLRRGFLQLTGPQVLIIDNASTVMDPEIDDDVIALARDVTNLSIVIAGRGRTTLEHPRVGLQVDRQLIGPADLAFTAQEIEELFRSAGQDACDGASVQKVTGGHPALVRAILQRGMATTNMSQRATLPSFVAAVVRSEVRRHLNDPRRRELARFLLRCSLPDSLSAGLVDRLGEGTRVAQHLQELERQGVMDTDPESGVITVWAAIREQLREEARARLPTELPDLHRRIALWELNAGLPLPALRHAVASDDYALVSTVIRSHWVQFLWDGILVEAEHIVAQIPRYELQHQPVIAALLGLAANMDPNRRRRAVGYLAIGVEGARRHRRAAARRQYLFFGMLETSLARIAGEDHRLISRSSALARTLDERTSQPIPRPSEPIVRTQLAITFFRSGRPREALEVLRDAVSVPADNPGLAAQQALSIKAGIYAHLGQMRTSRQLLARAAKLPWPPGVGDSYLGVLGHYAAVWDRVEEFDLIGAQEHLDVIAPQEVNIEFAPYIALLGAYLAALRGQADEGLVQLTDAVGRLESDRRLLPGERVMLVKPVALLNLASGRVGAARLALQSQDGAPISSVLLAVVELAAGRPEEALVHLATRQQNSATPRSAAVQHLVLAAASLRHGDRAGALAAAEQLVGLMGHHQVREHLVYVPRRDLVAIADLLVAERPDLGQPLGDLDQVPDIIPTPVDVGLLSKRENVVLRELSRHASTTDIARSLEVSPNTVKSQLRSIYRKLGATSRQDALATAVREGLLRGT